jgi:hypothetical protein
MFTLNLIATGFLQVCPTLSFNSQLQLMVYPPPFADESINDWLSMRNASQGLEKQVEAPN